MTSGDRLSREALIEAAHGAMQPHRNPVAEPELTRRIRDDAARVVGAVLPLIADAIEAEFRDTVKSHHPEWCQGYGVGMGAAEALVRSLATPKEEA